MTLKEKLQKAWDNRHQIAEGFYNTYISLDDEIKQEIERRNSICKGCEYYNKEGDAEIVVVKGEPACLLCGCNISIFNACMSCTCSAVKVGLKPRWFAVSTPEQETIVAETKYQEQFKPKE